ncbi:MAG: hypothetical protein HY898_02055 [Deltaproteobacteria bacterium]|nr:hypothetical protein [Deltaproteobacteria bacterium]
MNKRVIIGVAAFLLTLSFAVAASAQNPPKKKTGPATKGVITLADITIVGRVQKPVAAIDVAKIRPKVALAELRQPFIERIEEAIFKEPF